jgi:hypothetical protein
MLLLRPKNPAKRTHRNRDAGCCAIFGRALSRGEELSWKCAMAAFGFLISDFFRISEVELSGFPACCHRFSHPGFNHTPTQAF